MIFCATGRSGSTVIFDDFFNIMGEAQVNAEPFLTHYIHEKRSDGWARVWEQVKKTNTIADIVAVKVMMTYLHYLSEIIGGRTPEGDPYRPVPFSPTHSDDFVAFFRDAIWVYTDRQNVWAQAVSLFIAVKTSVWERRSDKKEDIDPTPPDVEYDRGLLFHIANKLMFDKKQWEALFLFYGIRPVRIEYEDVLSNYPGYLEPLCRSAGLTPLLHDPPRRLIRLRSETNQKLENRLRKEWSAEFGE
jgi:LPS sulfotransferase NodH